MLAGAGICFVVPYGLLGQFSVEYPSVAAGLIELASFVWLSVPKKARPPKRVWLRIFYPYLLFVGFLIAAKYLFSRFEFSFGQEYKAVLLYQPGMVFIAATILYLHFASQKDLFLMHLDRQKSPYHD